MTPTRAHLLAVAHQGANIHVASTTQRNLQSVACVEDLGEQCNCSQIVLPPLFSWFSVCSPRPIFPWFPTQEEVATIRSKRTVPGVRTARIFCGGSSVCGALVDLALGFPRARRCTNGLPHCVLLDLPCHDSPPCMSSQCVWCQKIAVQWMRLLVAVHAVGAYARTVVLLSAPGHS